MGFLGWAEEQAVAEEKPAGTVAPSFLESFPGLRGSAPCSRQAVGTRREEGRGGAGESVPVLVPKRLSRASLGGMQPVMGVLSRRHTGDTIEGLGLSEALPCELEVML